MARNKNKFVLTAATIVLMAALLPIRVTFAHHGGPHEAPASASQLINVLPELSVVVASSEQQLVTIGLTECDAALASSTNLVQDTGLINLNQPASCFAINHKQLVVQEYLPVQTALDSRAIAVPVQPVVYNQWHSALPELPAATVPVAAALFVGLIVLFVTPLTRRRLNSDNTISVSPLTLAQLQMRRC